MFPPIQCSKSSYFTQWLLSEYLNRVESGGGVGVGVGLTPNSSTSSSSTTNSSSSSSKLTSPASAVELTSVASSSDVTVGATVPRSATPPPTPSSNHHHHNHHHHQQQQQQHHHHHATFTALKQLFSSHTKHHGSSSNNKSNNNEYKNNNGLSSQQQQQLHHKPGDPLSSPKNIEFIQMLALNALEFTAPIYSFLNKKQTPEQEKQHQQSSSSSSPQQQQQQQDNNINQQQHEKRQVITTTTAAKCPSTRTFVQLSGHPGSFAPAGPNSVWKKMPEDQGGSCCGRQQEGSGIGTSATLRELLQELNLKGDSISIEARRDSLKQSLALLTSPSSSPQRKVPPSCYLEEDTIPITVFFNSNGNNDDNPSSSSNATTATTTSSSSSSTTSGGCSTTLMPPQICNIPFHMLPNENQVYRRVNSASPPDPLTRVIPKYITETCYNSQMFLELEDLLTNFEHGHPTIMDIKLGTRTFLEAEVKNNKPRPDLYQKLISVDPTACTQQEHEQKAVTKLTYMMFREKQSSSNSLGFRVEGVKIGDNGEYKSDKQLGVNFKMLREEPEICAVIAAFCKGNSKLLSQFLKRLELIRDTLEQSEFFMTHEVIGCSLLFIHDEISVDLRLIDFAKTFEVGGGGGGGGDGGRRITHREPWVMGNREDGVLTGIDSLIRLFKRLNDQGIRSSSSGSTGDDDINKHDDDDDDDHDKRI